MHLTQHTMVLAFLGLFLVQTTWAQKLPMKWGKISDEHKKMKTYEADPDASAVILCDYGEANFDVYKNKLQIIYTRHTRIKVLTKAGQDWAEVSIPYYAKKNTEEIIELKAQVHNVGKDGKVSSQKVSRKAIFDEDIDGKWHTKKFSVPNDKYGGRKNY